MAKRQTRRLPQAVELPSGSFRCRVLVDGKRLSFTADTAAEAQQMALVAKAGIERKSYSKAETIGSVVDKYIDAKEGTLSPSTIRAYRACRKSAAWMDKPLNKMTPAMWQKFINEQIKKGISAKSVSNTWGLVRPAVEMETGYAPKATLPQKIKAEKLFLDDVQVKQFIKACEGDQAELAILFGLHSLRRSEILGLRWEDIDLKRKEFRVNGAMVLDSNGNLVRKKETKTAQSRRVIRIVIPRLLELLEEEPDKTGAVVRIPKDSIYRRTNAICKSLGFPEIGAHGLRHTFASLCFCLDLPPKAVQEMGGWSDQRVLMDIYTHLSNRQENRYNDILEKFWQG